MKTTTADSRSIKVIKLSRVVLMNETKGTGAYTAPPLDFFPFNYFFIGTDVRIRNHFVNVFILRKKIDVLGKGSLSTDIHPLLYQDLYLIYSCMNNYQILIVYTTKGSLQNKIKIILSNYYIDAHCLS